VPRLKKPGRFHFPLVLKWKLVFASFQTSLPFNQRFIEE
jgi:hypothetical protein